MIPFVVCDDSEWGFPELKPGEASIDFIDENGNKVIWRGFCSGMTKDRSHIYYVTLSNEPIEHERT